MNRALQRYLEAASGLTTLTAAKAEQIVKGLVRSGEAAGDQFGELVDDLIARQRRNREAMTTLVKHETSRAVHVMGLASNQEVERLQKEVAELRRELTRFERAVTGSAGPAAKKAARKTTKKAAKKSTGRTPAKKSAKKATKRAAGKKATAKKATAKKATRKSTGSS